MWIYLLLFNPIRLSFKLYISLVSADHFKHYYAFLISWPCLPDINTGNILLYLVSAYIFYHFFDLSKFCYLSLVYTEYNLAFLHIQSENISLKIRVFNSLICIVFITVVGLEIKRCYLCSICVQKCVFVLSLCFSFMDCFGSFLFLILHFNSSISFLTISLYITFILVVVTMITTLKLSQSTKLVTYHFT